MGRDRGWRPDGKLMVTGTELADWLAVGQPALQAHLEAGRLVREGQLYDLKASIRLYSAHMREVAAGRGDQEVADAKKRLDHAKASLAELKLAAAAGQMVEASDVERVWTDVLRQLRSRILAVPNRVRQLLGHLGEMETRVIDRELRDALAELGGEDEAKGVEGAGG